MPTRQEPDGRPLSRAVAQTLLVSSLLEVIDCDRRLQAMKIAFRAKLEPEKWREIIATEAQRQQTIAVALAVFDTAAVFTVGTAAESRARQLLERNDSWTLDQNTLVRHPDLARVDREARREVRHPHRSGLD